MKTQKKMIAMEETKKKMIAMEDTKKKKTKAQKDDNEISNRSTF
jgi:hypothetical protein